MTHRIDASQARGEVVLHFQGLLDRAALDDALVSARAAHRGGAQRVVLLLEPGTEVAPELVETVRGLAEVTVRARAPYLARWLDGRRGST